MGQKLSGWMYRISNGRGALSALALFLLFTALVLPGQSSKGNADSPDLSFYYTADDLYQLAEEYGASGRQTYIRARFTFDLIWPLVYTAFLGTAISWIFARIFSPGSPWRQANLMPVLGALFDYLENLSTTLVMARYPNLTAGVAALAGVFTLVKWVLISGSFALLLVGVSAGVWQWLRGSGSR